MLAVDAVTGEEYLKLKEKYKTEDVSSYFAELVSACLQQGVNKVSVILDNNSTHKHKMQAQLQAHLSDLEIPDKIVVEFIHTLPYSPNFNLAKYIIHLLRLQFLHHLSLGVNIQQIQQKPENYFQKFQLQSSEQIQDTIRHICALVQ